MHRPELLKQLKEFAVKLAAAAESPPRQNPRRPLPPVAFSTAEYGGLALWDAHAVRYLEILSEMKEQAGDSISDGKLRDLIQLAILKTLDQRGRWQDRTAEQRATEAVSELDRALRARQATWAICLPVYGLTPPDPDWSLGPDVSIVAASGQAAQDLLNEADTITDSTTSSEFSKSAAKADLRAKLGDESPTLAIVKVKARDADAAWILGKRKLRFVLDCLNFAIDVLYGPYHFHELSDVGPGRPHRNGLAMNVDDRSSQTVQSELSGNPPNPIVTEKLRKDVADSEWLARISELLSATTPNGYQKRILAAVHWAGRAMTRHRPEEAVLDRAIALESLILGDKNDAEITNRLALSITHLLGDWLTSRKECVAMLKRLYGFRSKIVHAGLSHVAPSDQAAIRQYVNYVIARLLSHPRFVRMSSGKELDEWFAAALRGDADQGQAPS